MRITQWRITELYATHTHATLRTTHNHNHTVTNTRRQPRADALGPITRPRLSSDILLYSALYATIEQKRHTSRSRNWLEKGSPRTRLEISVSGSGASVAGQEGEI